MSHLENGAVAQLRMTPSEKSDQEIAVQMNERDRIGKGHHEKEEPFYAGQGRILEMIAASAPLADILTRIVLLMEAQSDGLRCSILLLSNDGKHVRRGAEFAGSLC